MKMKKESKEITASKATKHKKVKFALANIIGTLQIGNPVNQIASQFATRLTLDFWQFRRFRQSKNLAERCQARLLSASRPGLCSIEKTFVILKIVPRRVWRYRLGVRT
jgi:hypothetical protein